MLHKKFKNEVNDIGLLAGLYIYIKLFLRELISHILWTPVFKMQAKLCNVSYGRNLKVWGLVRVHNRGQILIGSDVRIRSGFNNYVGGSSRSAFWVSRGGSLIIGNNTGISNTTIISYEEIMIGDNVFIGGGSKIYDTNFHEISASERINNSGNIASKSISIGSGAFIGGHSIILKGSIVGINSVLAAGSVLSGKVPDNQIWGGNPSKFIKEIS